MRFDHRRGLGTAGERQAEAHLTRAGYEVLERNYRNRYGEVDLVALGRGALVFCEVRTHLAGSVRGPATPLESIGNTKRRQVREMARHWMRERNVPPRVRAARMRFDAIGVVLDSRGRLVALDHIEDAF
jgi:putative endonuclease